MMWAAYLTLAVVLIEAAIIWFYLWTVKNLPTYAIWIILGSKVFKLMVAAVAIIAVRYLSEDIPFKDFCIATIIGYLVGMVVEVIFFLKKKK